MKKYLIALAMGAVLLTPVSETFALSEGEGRESGFVDLDQEEKKGPFYVGGGTWYYDYIGVDHYSQYNHTSLGHRASVSNSEGTVRSVWKNSREGWAYAQIRQSYSGNKAYWDTMPNFPRLP